MQNNGLLGYFGWSLAIILHTLGVQVYPVGIMLGYGIWPDFYGLFGPYGWWLKSA